MYDHLRLQSRIEELRWSKRLKHKDIYEQAGITPGYYHMLTRGNVKSPSYVKLRALAAVLGVTVSYLTGEADFVDLDEKS